MKIINMTPHEISLNNGQTFAPSGQVARVAAKFEHTAMISGCECDICRNGAGVGCPSNGIDIFEQRFGDVECLPDPAGGTFHIVSAMVLDAVKSAGRTDCLAPATGHPDTVRNEKGHIVSVPGFVR